MMRAVLWSPPADTEHFWTCVFMDRPIHPDSSSRSVFMVVWLFTPMSQKCTSVCKTFTISDLVYTMELSITGLWKTSFVDSVVLQMDLVKTSSDFIVRSLSILDCSPVHGHLLARRSILWSSHCKTPITSTRFSSWLHVRINCAQLNFLLHLFIKCMKTFNSTCNEVEPPVKALQCFSSHSDQLHSQQLHHCTWKIILTTL